MVAVCVADFRCDGSYGNESGLHERVVERSAWSLPDCRRYDHANHRNVDCEKDFEDQDLGLRSGLRSLVLGLWSWAFEEETKSQNQSPKTQDPRPKTKDPSTKYQAHAHHHHHLHFRLHLA